MKKVGWFSLIALSFLLSSCTKVSDNGALYIPSPEDATAKASLEELQQGRTLYQDNCGSCHRLYSPDDFSAQKWKTIMSDMTPYTAMTETESNLALKYVTRGN